MKHCLFMLSMVISMIMPLHLWGQNNSLSQTVDSSQVKDEIEAFSDTLSTDSITTLTTSHHYSRQIIISSEDLRDFLSAALDDPGMHSTMIGGLTIAGIVLFVFFIAPLLLFALLVWLVLRNRRRQSRLHQEPDMRRDSALAEPMPENRFGGISEAEEMRTRGIRQTCLGIGLMIFLGYLVGDVGVGVGALVAAIGVGNLLAARRKI